MLGEELRIPNRFESLQEVFGQEVRPLIVPIDQDLVTLNALRDRARVQNGGLLIFLLGPSGIGKTTAVYSASVHMPEVFAPVLAVPVGIALRDAAGWLTQNLPPASSSKAQIVLFDGREVSDDNVGLRQVLSALNQILRRRPDVLFCWPTTDADWHKQVRDLAETIGGANFVPKESDLWVAGPPTGDWPSVLERLLLQFGKTYDDVGLGRDLIGTMCAERKTIGDFLTGVGSIVADRVTRTRESRRLPQLVFVITSSGEVVGESNRIRRAGTQTLAPEPLLGYSPKSEVGKWWAERNKDPNHHLGYIISLFDSRLVTMTASAVVYACLHSGNDKLRLAATNANARPDKGNARRAVAVSEFCRFLSGTQIPEFTSGKKGGMQQSTADAYAAIQAMSTKHHKSINLALCSMVREQVPGMTFSEDDLEVAQGGDVITDAIIKYNNRQFSLEFHHVSQNQCAASGMASYIMDKLRLYAWYHQLIPR